MHQAHREPGPAVGLDAAVQQRRDVRMIELREMVALAHEGIDQCGRRHLGAHAFQRDVLLVLAIGTTGAVHGTHAARSQHVIDPPRAQPVADARRRVVGIVLRGHLTQQVERRDFERVFGRVGGRTGATTRRGARVRDPSIVRGPRTLRRREVDILVEQIQRAGFQVGHRRQSVKGRTSRVRQARRPRTQCREGIALSRRGGPTTNK